MTPTLGRCKGKVKRLEEDTVGGPVNDSRCRSSLASCRHLWRDPL
jgi:hypothetical protein